jgi:hypothetical protein
MVPLNGGKDIGEVRFGHFGGSAYPVWKFAYLRGSKAAWDMDNRQQSSGFKL